jgi:hypothetical protein
MEILCRVTDTGLVPMYDSDLEEKKRLRVGETVLCNVKKARNYDFHKKFFALVRLTLDNMPEQLAERLGIYDEEDMLAALKLELGLFTTAWYQHTQVVRLSSISFSNMDETEFQVFYNRCLNIIETRYLRGVTREDLLEEINRFK